MRKTIAILILISLVASPVYAANKIGLGIDFSKKDDEEEVILEGKRTYSKGNAGVRLYYEHVLKQFIGIQLEFGFCQYKTEYRYDYDGKEIDLSGLFKYYFYLKGNTSVYIGGGLGLNYQKFKLAAYQETETDTEITLIEQAAIGIQFPLTKRLSVFVEDRFINKISDGRLRFGLYINLGNVQNHDILR